MFCASKTSQNTMKNCLNGFKALFKHNETMLKTMSQRDWGSIGGSYYLVFTFQSNGTIKTSYVCFDGLENI